MDEAILVINAGSSSVKFAAFKLQSGEPHAEPAFRGQVAGIGERPRFVVQRGQEGGRNEDLPPAGVADHTAAIGTILDWLQRHADGWHWSAVGHRVVHGGHRRDAARLSPALLRELQSLVCLAPQHQPQSLDAVEAVGAALPDVAQVACFDTAFHASQPAIARLLPLPAELRRQGLERYGFHGLSYESIVHALPRAAGAALPARLVVAHLGNGASLCALRHGQSVATTMGFSTLDGLVMGSRCGTLDPGVLLYLMGEQGMSADQLSDLLYRRSGLLGVSGFSSDMGTLLESEAPEAALAVELFVATLVRMVGAMAAELGGLDALVFTGGIGEHAAPVRAAACEKLAWLGVAMEESANREHRVRISAGDSTVAVWVVPTREEWMIARHTAALVGA